MVGGIASQQFIAESIKRFVFGEKPGFRKAFTVPLGKLVNLQPGNAVIYPKISNAEKCKNS